MRTILVTLVLAATLTSAPALAQDGGSTTSPEEVTIKIEAAPKRSKNDNSSLLGRPATHGNGMAVEFDSAGSITAVNCPGITWGELGEPTQHIASKRLAELMVASGQNGVDCGIAIKEIALATARADAIRTKADAEAWALKVRTGAGAALADDVPTYLTDDVLATGDGPAQMAALSGMYQNGNMPFNPALGLQGVAANYAAWSPGMLVAPAPQVVAQQPATQAQPPEPKIDPATAVKIDDQQELIARQAEELRRLRAATDARGEADAAADIAK